MTVQHDPRLLQQLDLMRDLGQLTLAATQALLGQQLAYARAVVARNGDRLQDLASGSVDSWAAALQGGLQEAAEATRESKRLGALLQLHSMRLFERQSREAQLLVAAAESLLLAALPALAAAEVVATAPSRRQVAGREPEQRLAA